MSATLEATPAARRRRRASARVRRAPTTGQAPVPRPFPVLDPWLWSQAGNSTRHAAALRPFSKTEFGTDAAAPSEGHLQAANHMISALRAELLKINGTVRGAAAQARKWPSRKRLQRGP